MGLFPHCMTLGSQPHRPVWTGWVHRRRKQGRGGNPCPIDCPVCVAQAEPSFRAQLWRTVRTLAVAFLVLSGVGALVEERGLTKGILNNPDMRPQLETKTKFADVKGVDEAKARCQPCSAALLD